MKTSALRNSSIALGVCFALAAFQFRDIYIGIFEKWQSSTYSHSFIIIPIVLWLVWRRRAAFREENLSPSLLGAISVAVLVAVIGLAKINGTHVVADASAVALIPALVFAVFGWSVVKALRFPLLYLAFAIPAGDALVPYLQDFTAHFTVEAIRLTGIPVILEGRYIYLATGAWEVAEACSGIRYLTACLALGTLYASLHYRTWSRRALFIAASGIVPVVANGIRAFGIVLLAHLTSNKLGAGVDHFIYGGVFFAFVIALLMAVGAMIREPRAASPGEDPALNASPRTAPNISVRLAIITSLVFASQLAIPAGVSALARPSTSTATLFAPAPQGWNAVDNADGWWKPSFPKASSELKQSFRNERRTVSLYIAYYANQSNDVELVSSTNQIVSGDSWRRISEGDFFITAAKPVRQVTEMFVRSGGQEKIVWYWYDIAGHRTTSRYAAKFYQLQALLVNGRTDAAIFAVSTDSTSDPTGARRDLAAFLIDADLGLHSVVRDFQP